MKLLHLSAERANEGMHFPEHCDMVQVMSEWVGCPVEETGWGVSLEESTEESMHIFFSSSALSHFQRLLPLSKAQQALGAQWEQLPPVPWDCAHSAAVPRPAKQSLLVTSSVAAKALFFLAPSCSHPPPWALRARRRSLLPPGLSPVVGRRAGSQGVCQALNDMAAGFSESGLLSWVVWGPCQARVVVRRVQASTWATRIWADPFPALYFQGFQHL